jgi:hypothetical protein
MSNENFVYTALFGQYETLNELTFKKNDSTHYVCFTDDEKLRSDTWEIRLIIPPVLNDSIRSSRYLKMLGHRYFPQNSKCLYIDNSVELKVDGSEILNAALVGRCIALMPHSSRKTVRNEFFIVSAYGLARQDTLWSQFRKYKLSYPSVLKEAPYWGGMIAKINCEESDNFMSIWYEEYNKYTRRDQLSLNLASYLSEVEIGIIPGKNDLSEWHVWPVIKFRNTQSRDTTSGKKFRKVRIIMNALYFGSKYYLK